MIWSKSKRAIKALLADSVRDRVQFHMTRYGPGVSHIMARAWITWDGKEIANFSTIKALQEPGLEHPEGEIVDELPGIPSRYAFVKAVEEYLDAPIEQSISSEDSIVKALALFDRRIGKRRLLKLVLSETEHPLVRQFYKLRCEAEGLRCASTAPV